MNRDELFVAIGGIEDGLLARSDKKVRKDKGNKKWLPLVACLGIVVVAVAFYAQLEKEPHSSVPCESLQQGSQFHEDQFGGWTAYYNTGERCEMDYARVKPIGYFYEDLTKEQIDSILPAKIFGWEVQAGRGYFFADGTVDNVVLDISTGSGTVQVTMGNYFQCVVYMIEETVSSRCGDVVYNLYRHELPAGTLLEADGQVNDVPLHFYMQTDTQQQGMTDFEAVLDCFACYGDGLPDLSRVKPRNIPEFINEELEGLKQAYLVPKLGSLMPKNLPDGFCEETIRRYKDGHSDYLSGLWTRGYDELSWQVSCFSQQDEARLTSTTDLKNYDVSLYPIPRADSVPPQLWEIVDDPVFLAQELTPEAVKARAYTVEDTGEGAASVRMKFCVKYGDFLVRIRTKGVDPQWLYEQLMLVKP